jgi:hypothetical protein
MPFMVKVAVWETSGDEDREHRTLIDGFGIRAQDLEMALRLAEEGLRDLVRRSL